MYEEFFGLERRPFTATPDAANFVPLEGPQAALDALAVCCERGQGIGVLTGEAGLGKTLLGLRLAFELQPTFATAFLNHSAFPTRRSLLQAILFELNRPYNRMSEQELRLELMTALKALRPQQQALVVILDEAHRLSASLLDEMRMLTLLAAGTEPLVRVVLIGNRDLEERLADSELSAFNQRICCQVDLVPLTQAESVEYLRTCINMAGAHPDDLFAEDALPCIAKAADGVPRCLNHLADHSLLLAYVTEQRPVTAEVVREALHDLKQLPLHWNDPIGGGEIYRGLSQPVMEDSAVDLWPRTEQRVAEEAHSADSWERTELGQETAAIEIGCSANEETSAVESTADRETDDITCLKDNWRTAPAQLMDEVLADVADLAEIRCGSASPCGSVESTSFTDHSDNSPVGEVFAARELEFGSPTPQSFAVEEFASTPSKSSQQSNKDFEDTCDDNEFDDRWPTADVPQTAGVAALFDLAESEVPVWNLSSRHMQSDNELEFEEEPVIDHYVRIGSVARSEGIVWNLGTSGSRFASRQASVAVAKYSDDYFADVDNSDNDDSDNSAPLTADSVASIVECECDSRPACGADSEIPSDRENLEDSSADDVPFLPTELRSATHNEDCLEEQIHAEVLGISADTQQMFQARVSDSDEATISEDRLADKLSRPTESEEPVQDFAGFDVVQPESIRGKCELRTERTTQTAQAGPIQRAYGRLFSDLRRKRKS